MIKDTYEDGEHLPLYSVKKEEINEPTYAEVSISLVLTSQILLVCGLV